MTRTIPAFRGPLPSEYAARDDEDTKRMSRAELDALLSIPNRPKQDSCHEIDAPKGGK
jgi:hypothetical protein